MRGVHVSLFEELGGEPVLRSIIDRFVDRMFADPMIGFFFRRANRQRIKDKEYELAAEHLGAEVQYRGRPLAQAHAPHPIMGGQFDRRLELLRTTLVEADAPPQVIEHWLAYTDAQRSVVTRDARGECTAAPSSSSPGVSRQEEQPPKAGPRSPR